MSPEGEFFSYFTSPNLCHLSVLWDRYMLQYWVSGLQNSEMISKWFSHSQHWSFSAFCVSIFLSTWAFLHCSSQMYPSGSLMLLFPLFPNSGLVFPSSLSLQFPLHLINLVFLAGLMYTAIVRLPCQAVFKDFTMLEWGPSLAQARTEGPLCLLPNSPVSP